MVFTGCNIIDPMMNNSTILTEIKGSISTIWLNRPAKKNALDIEMISSFLIALQYLNNLASIRIIVLRGKGESFCAGADLGWMQRSSLLTGPENYNECDALARCFYEIYMSSKITICMVHGSSIGGGNGLVAASDIALSDNSAEFAFSEVHVGLIPATIAPYVIIKAGKAKAMELMLSGRRFSAAEAKEWGLINHVLQEKDLENYFSKLVNDLLEGAPNVQKNIKTYLNSPERPIDASLIGHTASLLADARVGSEAKEGIDAFLEKRKPLWNQEIT